MRRRASLSPDDYLQSLPGGKEKVLPGFMNGQAEVWEFVGPHHFFRMGGWSANGQAASDLGAWWIDRDEVDAMLTDSGIPFDRNVDQRLSAMRKFFLHKGYRYRRGLAISRDWNSGEKVHELRVRAGTSVLGLLGLTERQFEYSTEDARHNPVRRFAGGRIQVYFRPGELDRGMLTGKVYLMNS